MARALRMMLAGGERLVLCPGSSASTAWLAKETSKHNVSTIQWRGRTNAASAASDVPNSQRGRRKVSKDERRAAVESYVNKYREANAGKFPTVSKAQQEVGGGHYTVRLVIQELKYKSKLDPPTTGVQKPTKEEPRENLKSITAGEDIPAQVRVDSRSEDAAETISSGDTSSNENIRNETTTAHEFVKPANERINPDLVEAPSTFLRKDDPEIPYPPERQEDSRKESGDDQPQLMSEEKHVKEETKEEGEEDTSTRNDDAEVSRAKAEVPKDLPDSDCPQMQEKQDEASKESDRDTDDQPQLMSEEKHVKEDTKEEGEEDTSTRNDAVEVSQAKAEVPKNLPDSGGPQMQEKQDEASKESDRYTEPPQKSVIVTEPPKRSSLWENLKSFADDIISIWRNK